MNNLSNFRFFDADYPNLSRLGRLAERSTYDDPSNTLTKLRILSEQMVLMIGEIEGYEDFEDLRQIDRLKKLEYDYIVPTEIKDILHKLRKSGNKGSHTGEATVAEAKFMLRQSFFLSTWFYKVYEEKDVTIDYKHPEQGVDKNEEYDRLEEQLAHSKEEALLYLQKMAELQAATEQQKEQRKERRVKAARKTEETEAETRERIDDQLREVGWECDTASLNYKTHKTLPQKGRNIAIAEWKCGSKWADYALFIGTQLVGIVEAKKHAKNVMSDLGQSKEYSREVREENGAVFPKHANADKYKIPFLFATNGRKYLEQIKEVSGIWYWDARHSRNPEKALMDWFSPDSLKEKLAFDSQAGAEKLAATPYDILTNPEGLNLRYYQIEAIKAVEKKVNSDDPTQRALLAMATGTGKTRTIIGLAYRLIASKRFRRILFLVDRRMLGDQAENAFKEVKIEGLQTFAQIYDLQGLSAAAAELDTKIHFATVQSMVQRIAYSETPPNVGDYDCIIVDEAHRGYTFDKEMSEEEVILRDQLDFQSKYRMVLDHFDAYRIGLTATPAVHTSEIFGHPVYTYSYPKAVVDGYLIDFEPPVVFQTKLSQNGIVWNQGDAVKVYDPEDNEIVDLGITEDVIKKEIQSFNKSVINESFNRTILRELIENPDYAIHPDDKKKTLIFAATDIHADTIVRILKEEYAEMGEDVEDEAIIKLTGTVRNREDLLRKYKINQYPSIVVTVDLLTTGIDVPSICNLVFLRRVNSRILYDQMLGRATRKCDDIGKDVFKVYDAVGVSEIMAKEETMKPVAPSPKKTFVHLMEELELIEDEYLQQTKIDRIIAKMQRKVRGFDEQQMDSFQVLAGEPSLEDFARKLKATDPDKVNQFFEDHMSLWEFMDREKGRSYASQILYSDHEDRLEETSYAYEKNLKPKDYLESFTEFVKNNMNEVAALKLVCTKPSELTRKDLKEISVILNEKGYGKVKLNTAYQELTNEAVVADIIAHIRTAALGSDIIAHDVRIENAVNKLIDSNKWNSVQLKWIEKIQKQLLQESIVTLEDLSKPPFSNEGGLKRLNKVFKNETETIIKELNEYLYNYG